VQGKVNTVAVVVLTGATRGIGRAAAIELAGQGAEVALVACDPERVKSIAEEATAAEFATDWLRRSGMAVAMVETGGDTRVTRPHGAFTTAQATQRCPSHVTSGRSDPLAPHRRPLTRAPAA
jgi:NAD(P)-dependent dehydrogenase (short-subunit alcohol dehydrogenase family)